LLRLRRLALLRLLLEVRRQLHWRLLVPGDGGAVRWQHEGPVSPRDRAAQLLRFYIRHAWEAAGKRWDGDNDAEIEVLVDALIGAARETAS
jgi:hypothetical protein